MTHQARHTPKDFRALSADREPYARPDNENTASQAEASGDTDADERRRARREFDVEAFFDNIPV